ncbi:hypothetical protein HDU84_001232, partial [Entophlyctis sp. JEL0112]
VFCTARHAEDQQKVQNGEPSVLTNARVAFQNILAAGLEQLDAEDRKKTIVLVVDALDECGKPGSSHHRSLLKLLSEEATHLPPFVRIFATGRPEHDIFEAMETLDSMVLLQNDEENRKDMIKFVGSMFSERLVDHSAYSNAAQVQKGTPLHFASSNGHLEVVKWLVDHGARVNDENTNKWTPLHFASSNGHLEVVKWLVDHGANVNSENVNKWTPLHIASSNGHLEVVKWLVDHGANVNAENVNES